MAFPQQGDAEWAWRMLEALSPCLPPHWPSVELRLQRDGRAHPITLTRDEAHLRALLPATPTARVLRAGEWIDLDALSDGQPLLVRVVGADTSPAVPASETPVPKSAG